jgi:hypothetical protein
MNALCSSFHPSKVANPGKFLTESFRFVCRESQRKDCLYDPDSVISISSGDRFPVLRLSANGPEMIDYFRVRCSEA